jgi:hypothetical protein
MLREHCYLGDRADGQTPHSATDIVSMDSGPAQERPGMTDERSALVF